MVQLTTIIYVWNTHADNILVNMLYIMWRCMDVILKHVEIKII